MTNHKSVQDLPPKALRIVRKRGNEYHNEEITVSPNHNREDLINRLRNDPSVIFVFDVIDGHYKERAAIPEGFEIAVSIDNNKDLNGHKAGEGHIVIYFNNDVVLYQQDSPWFDDDVEDDRPWMRAIENVPDHLNMLTVGSYVHCYGLRHPILRRADIFAARGWLMEYGFEYERINVVTGHDPVLFEYENEWVLLGSRHFSSYHIFIEVKRLRLPIDEDHKKEILLLAKVFPRVEVVFWEDGSVGFRSWFPDYLTMILFSEHLHSRMDEIRAFIAVLEDKFQYACNLFSDFEDIHQLFIYEAIDASTKLSQIRI